MSALRIISDGYHLILVLLSLWCKEAFQHQTAAFMQSKYVVMRKRAFKIGGVANLQGKNTEDATERNAK